MDQFFEWALEALGKQLGPGGFALFIVTVFFAWRWIVRDRDDRADRDQMAKEANARSEAMLRLAAALDNLTRNQEGIRATLADLRTVQERISARLDDIRRGG